MSTERSGLRACWTKLRGADSGDDRLEEPRLEAHALSLHVGARLAPQRQRGRVAAELDADLLEDPIGGPIDEVQAFLVQQAVGRNPAPHSRNRGGSRGGAALPAGAGAGSPPGAGGWGGRDTPAHSGSVPARWRPNGPDRCMDKAPREPSPAPWRRLNHRSRVEGSGRVAIILRRTAWVANLCAVLRRLRRSAASSSRERGRPARPGRRPEFDNPPQAHVCSSGRDARAPRGGLP